MSVQQETTTEQQTATTTEVDTSTTQQPTEVTQKTEGQDATAQTQEEQTSDAQAEGDKQTERDEQGRFKPKNGVQARIDELTKKAGTHEREAAYWRQQAQSKAQPSAEEAAPKPTPEKFADYGEYVEALTDWKAERAVVKALETRSAQEAAAVKTQTFQERQTEFSKVVHDYDQVVGESNTPIADHVVGVMSECEQGPALAYHFAKNPDVLLRLNGMDPLQAAREIGKLEVALSSTTFAKPVVPAKKQSSAPEPANTSSGQGRSVAPALADMPMEQYIAARKTQGASWAR